MDRTKLEMMLLHLLNTRSPNDKMWVAITLPGVGRFTREDVELELMRLRRHPKRWWEFWKP